MNRKMLYSLTIFFGSALLFGVQPMVGRTLLPFFGGTSAVWIVCLCAFQTLLLGGYFYAHRLSKGCASRPLGIHFAILFLSAIWAFLVADCRDGLNEFVSGFPPALGVILFLIVIVGVPYLALSANSSLVQSLASRRDGDVYSLYAVSNVGSLVGLFIYPFVLEPFVSVGNQWRLFGLGIAVYLLLLYLTNRVVGDAENCPRSTTAEKSAETYGSCRFCWIVLPALSCMLLNSITAHLTLDVIAMPLLWCILLALFLLSYVVGFSSSCTRLLPLVDILALLSAGALAFSFRLAGSVGFLSHMVGGCCLVLFGCSALHIRLYVSRPDAKDLTRYYLLGSVGGAVGGMMTGLVAPYVFTGVYEYPLSVAFLVLAIVLLREWRIWQRQLAFATLAVVILATLAYQEFRSDDDVEKVVFADRGFFGTVKVGSVKAMAGGKVGELHSYIHGSTRHGEQFLAEGYGLHPTLYHTRLGGGLAITQHPKYKSGQPMRVGILGMGVGVSCSYGRSNDVYRCWEISPEALNVATNPAYFTFSSHCLARVEPILADARIALERERSESAPKYDVLQIDAFSGDSAPYHLTTREAFGLYLDRLAPGGFLSVNISNWHIDFAPLLKAVVNEFGVYCLLYTPKRDSGNEPCVWGLFVKEIPEGIEFPPQINIIDLSKISDGKLPTDECGSLLGNIRFDRGN